MAAVTMEDLLQPHLIHSSQRKLMVVSKGLCELIVITYMMTTLFYFQDIQNTTFTLLTKLINHILFFSKPSYMELVVSQ